MRGARKEKKIIQKFTRVEKCNSIDYTYFPNSFFAIIRLDVHLLLK